MSSREPRGVCQRSGAKVALSQLVRDGQNPELLVLPEYQDPYHPQLRKRRLDENEGVVRNPSPRQIAITPPVLVGVQLGSDAGLAWSSASFSYRDTAGYRVFRRVDGGPWALVIDLPVQRDWLGAITVEPLAYTAAMDPGSNEFMIEAYDVVGLTAPSNSVTLAPSAGLVFQFLNVPLS